MKKLFLFIAFIFIVFSGFSQNGGNIETRNEIDSLGLQNPNKQIIIGDIILLGSLHQVILFYIVTLHFCRLKAELT